MDASQSIPIVIPEKLRSSVPPTWCESFQQFLYLLDKTHIILMHDLASGTVKLESDTLEK
jgi:hypothetical protein